MSDSITLNETSQIYVHIFCIDGDDFQWFTHPKTFQILENDTFNTFRIKILNKLSSKYAKDKANIIECLKQSHQLFVFIDRATDSKETTSKMLQKFARIKDKKIKLNNNIWNTIKTNMPINAKMDEICIWFIARNITIHKSNNNTNKKHINNDNTSNSYNNINTNNYNKPKRNNTNNNKHNKPKQIIHNNTHIINANINFKNNNEINRQISSRKTIESGNNKHKYKIKTKSIPKKRRQVRDYKNKSIEPKTKNSNSHRSKTKKLRDKKIKNSCNNSNNNSNNSNNSKKKIGLNYNNKNKSSRKHIMNKRIGSNTNTNNNRNISGLRDMTSLSKQMKNKTISKNKNKRKRMFSKNKHEIIDEPLPKKQKKEGVINWTAECIWLLIDTGPTMDTQIFDHYNTTKIEMIKSLMEIMVQNNWSKPECKSNHFRLFTFSNRLYDVTKTPYFPYNNQNAITLLNKFDQCEKESNEYENCMSYKHAISNIIEHIVYEKKNELNINHPLLNRNRIILFTDAERANIHIDIDAEKKSLQQKMTRYGIILDCVQVCKNKRRVQFLEQLCEHDNVGKYFNPINKTVNDYRAIMTSDIMFNVKLRDSSNNVIELD